MKYVTYIPSLGYPQPALFGRGVEHEDGTHTPTVGYASFSVEDRTLVYGADDRFYKVTAPGVLTQKTQAEVDKIAEKENDEKEALKENERMKKERVVKLKAGKKKKRTIAQVNTAIDDLIEIVEALTEVDGI